MSVRVGRRSAALAAALASFLIGGALAAWARRSYAQRILDRISLPPQVASPASPHAVVTNLVLFLGDSRVTDWGRPSIPGWQTVNAGMNGATTAEVRQRAPSLIAQDHPAIVVVEAGINDLKLLGVRPDLRDNIVRECVANLRSLSEGTTGQGCRVLLCKIWTAGRPELLRRLVWSDTVPQAIAEANRQLETLTNGNPRLRILDCFPNGIPPEWRRDALHLRAPAYTAAAEALRQELPPRK